MGAQSDCTEFDHVCLITRTVTIDNAGVVMRSARDIMSQVSPHLEPGTGQK